MTPEEAKVITDALQDLRERAKLITEELKDEVDTLEKTLAFPKDYFGVKMRASSIQDRANKLMWIAAKMDALSGIRVPPEPKHEDRGSDL